jgi:flagellar hook assembly protein FlgD
MHAGPICVSISPNPFNPVASIEYLMPTAGDLLVEIYDIRGGLVRTLVDGAVNSGSGRLTWNGRNGHGSPVSSGLYFCRITALGRMEVRKLLLIR